MVSAVIEAATSANTRAFMRRLYHEDGPAAVTVSLCAPTLERASGRATIPLRDDTRTTTGKGRRLYGNHSAICFETQHYPDSPNHPEFPSTVVTPASPLHEVTVYRFSTGG